MKSLIVFVHGLILAQGNIRTCSQCVDTKGMAWKVVHADNSVTASCVKTQECKELANEDETVMCYPLNCNKMPTNEAFWTEEGTYVEHRCSQDYGSFKCLTSAHRLCMWTKPNDDDPKREKPYCMFKAFADQLGINGYCPKGHWANAAIKSDHPVTGDKSIDVDYCSNCIYNKDNTWQLTLKESKTTGKATYNITCVPVSSCVESSSRYFTNVCLTTRSCDSYRLTDGIPNPWIESHGEYTQCAPYLTMEECMSDETCTYFKEVNGKGGYCTYAYLNFYFKNQELCSHSG